MKSEVNTSVTRTGPKPVKLAGPIGSQGLPVQTAFDRFCESTGSVQNRFFRFFFFKYFFPYGWKSEGICKFFLKSKK
jgi:hypothetical protein